MTKRFQIYKCEFCETIVEITRGGSGQLVCCGQFMKHCMESRCEAIRAEHIPVLEPVPQGLAVRVGICERHPMEQRHYVEWIEVIGEERTCRQFLSPGDTPSALFDRRGAPVMVRGYCNLHGLWRGYILMSGR
ncbi:MAG: desulfoferrodoxin FeS4 iron-binding domain-containing protein [bacterium]